MVGLELAEEDEPCIGEEVEVLPRDASREEEGGAHAVPVPEEERGEGKVLKRRDPPRPGVEARVDCCCPFFSSDEERREGRC